MKEAAMDAQSELRNNIFVSLKVGPRAGRKRGSGGVGVFPPIPASPVGDALFSELERWAIHIGATDPPVSGERERLIGRIAAILWRRQKPAALASARLEALRRLVSALLYGSDELVEASLAGTRQASFEERQLNALILAYGPAALRHRVLAASEDMARPVA
jgi:hypothetical protein